VALTEHCDAQAKRQNGGRDSRPPFLALGCRQLRFGAICRDTLASAAAVRGEVNANPGLARPSRSMPGANWRARKMLSPDFQVKGLSTSLASLTQGPNDQLKLSEY